jgi:hypothetical protein
MTACMHSYLPDSAIRESRERIRGAQAKSRPWKRCSWEAESVLEVAGDPLTGPPIVARRCAPDEGTGSRKWEPSKGASDR